MQIPVVTPLLFCPTEHPEGNRKACEARPEHVLDESLFPAIPWSPSSYSTHSPWLVIQPVSTHVGPHASVTVGPTRRTGFVADDGRFGRLSWPHFGRLIWPHPCPMADRSSERCRARRGGRGRDGIEGGAFRADSA
jgi:hypothetical protein